MCILLLLFFIILNPRKNEGGKKLRKVQRGLKWKNESGWSSERKPSCSNTALKRWMAIEMRWNKNKCSLSSPLRAEIRRPKSSRNARADSLMGPSVSTAIGWKIIIILLLLVKIAVCLVEFCSNVSELWCVEKSRFEFGLVNQALSAAFRTLIKVCFLHHDHHNGLAMALLNRSSAAPYKVCLVKTIN